MSRNQGGARTRARPASGTILLPVLSFLASGQGARHSLHSAQGRSAWNHQRAWHLVFQVGKVCVPAQGQAVDVGDSELGWHKEEIHQLCADHMHQSALQNFQDLSRSFWQLLCRDWPSRQPRPKKYQTHMGDATSWSMGTLLGIFGRRGDSRAGKGWYCSPPRICSRSTAG